MALSSDQIERIKSRSDGWDKDWALLYVEIMEALERGLGSIGIDWPNDTERQIFAAKILARYEIRAQAGTLLAGLSGDDPVPYLTGKDFLYKRAVSHLKARVVTQSLQSTRSDGESSSKAADDAVARPSTASEGVRTRVLDALKVIRLDVDPGDSVDRTVEQAGIQLFPRLDWDHRNHGPLREHLPTVVVGSSKTWAGCENVLGKHHDEARDELHRRQHDKAEELSKTKEGTRKRKQLEGRLQQLLLDEVMMPLSASRLMEILGVSADLAYKVRQLYKKARRRLLSGLFGLLEQLGQDQMTEVA